MTLQCKSKSIKWMEKVRVERVRPWITEHGINQTIRTEMRNQYYAEKINDFDGDTRQQWFTIREFLTNKLFVYRSSIDAIYDTAGHIVVNKKKIANILNRYFLNIGRNLHDQIPRHIDIWLLPEMELNLKSIQLISTTTEEVLEKIEQLRNCNNVHDIIPTDSLKYHKFKYAPVLAEFFNASFRKGLYPRKLKVDRIVPIFKSLDPLEPNNYRPISVPQNLSKLMESIICDRITDFCLDHEIINANQFGYLKNSSDMSAVVSIVDHLQVDLAKNPHSIGACLFIDLKKASNTIPHDRLMEKLHRIGIRGPLCRLIHDYLHERRQFIDIDNVVSDQVVNRNKFSIPQGSTLGPLFVILYINDIFKLKLFGKLILYADDTALVYVERDAETLKTRMEYDLALLNRWFAANLLTLNTEKTKAMLFNAHDPAEQWQINLMINNQRIEFVKCHKYLGMYLQNDLQWDVHIEKIIREIDAAAQATKRIGSHIADDTMLLAMYFKLVRAPMSRMPAVYGTFATKIQLQNLQTAQNNAIKIIFAVSDDDDVNEIYVKHELLDVQQMIEFDLALMVYKWEKGLMKLNRTVENLNGPNVLSVATKYFQQLDPSFKLEGELNFFKKEFRSKCANLKKYQIYSSYESLDERKIMAEDDTISQSDMSVYDTAYDSPCSD